MAKNYKSSGDRVDVTAAAARTSGQLVLEEGLPGICQTDAASGASYALALEGVYDVPFVTGAVVGNQVLISTDGNNTVTVAARGTAIGAGVAFAGRVVAVPGAGLSAIKSTAPPATGFMSVKLSGGNGPA